MLTVVEKCQFLGRESIHRVPDAGQPFPVAASPCVPRVVASGCQQPAVGLKAMLRTGWMCPVSAGAAPRSFMGQSLTAPSAPADARVWPSGLRATRRSSCVCPFQECMTRPEKASSSRTTPSEQAAANCVPCAVNAMSLMGLSAAGTRRRADHCSGPRSGWHDRHRVPPAACCPG